MHSLDNRIFTVLCLNYAKHTFVPAVLQIVGDYLNSKGDHQARQEVTKKMDSVWLVGLLAAYKKATRISTASVEALEELKEAWIAAEILDEVPSTKSWQYCLSELGTMPACAEDIQSFTKEIEEETGHEFARGADGAPYPYAKATMPKDWSWGTAWVFFCDRALRCWLWCNGRW